MSKLRRRADGKPEFRSLDELLAEAAQDDVVQRLPGKGRPIELGGYMHADAGTRVTNKLLADNDVIPQVARSARSGDAAATGRNRDRCCQAGPASTALPS